MTRWNTLSNAEYRLAKRIEAAGLATLSQAVKAIERDEPRLQEWLRLLEKIEKSK